jgi:asparagine synthase (glutamine-hydrolysing)
MCGITGFIGSGEEADLRRMNAALIHRGPDSEGYWHDCQQAVYLAHKRLAIIDIRDGSQPMWTADRGLCITFNGEIYNHRELREMLIQRGHRFATDHSDTEVLLHGFREWGADLPNRLNGMWAFAIYEPARRRIFLSRDRFGKKPLFYTQTNNLFAFASELSALARHSLLSNLSISRPSLKKYFAYGYIPAPHSIYAGILKLPAGHNLNFDLDTGAILIQKYWDFVLEPFASVPAHPEETWGEQLRELLDRAVSRRLMSDVPLGVFLSGGIDSSAIAAFAARHLPSGALKTFSIGFEETSFDESAHAQRVATLLKTDHHCDRLSLEKARGLLPEIIGRLDEPMGDSSLLPTYLLCQNTRQEVTVALGGDGSDELFAGYDPFRALRLASLYRTMVPRPIHPAICSLMARLPTSHRNMSLDFKLKRTVRGLAYPRMLWNPIWLGPLEPKELTALFNEPCSPEEIYSEAIEQWEACRSADPIDKTLQFYTKLYLQDDILVKIDRASMLNSLEVRAPFLDIEVVDFARRIPGRFKFRHGQTKYILKKALEPMLPHEILYRSKKGFGVPIGPWFRDGALECTDVNDCGLTPGYMHNRISEHRRGSHDHRGLLWNYWLLQQWRGGYGALRP